MRACHVIHALGPGGAEHLLLDLAGAAHASNLELSVVGLTDSPEPVHRDQLLAMGVPVRSLGLTSRWDPRALTRGLQAIESLRPDVIHTHMKHADLVGARASRKLGAPMVSTLHIIDDASGPVGRAKRWAAGRARDSVAARTLAVSEAQRQWYLRTFPAEPSKVVTVHNGVRSTARVKPEERERLRASLGVPPQTLIAANVAIMRPGKGHDVLLEAVAQLPESSPVVVVLVGDGPERSRLEAQAQADPRVASRVRFVGYRDDVAELLQVVDLMVHPTFADALPTALIQGLAAALPIIATRVGGIPEILGEDCGVLLPPGDPRGLAKSLARLAEEPERRTAMGGAGRARFEAMFEAGRWAATLHDLYDQVLREAATR